MSDRGRVRVETGHKHVRALFAGEVVADTTSPLLVWEGPHFPTYYVPETDVVAGRLVGSERTEHSPSRGEARDFHVRVGDAEATDAALSYPESPIPELRGAVRLDWQAMDAWFEEDEQVYIHPRSPYTRIDALRSRRHVRIEIDGEVVADSVHPVLLFETGLAVRYYLPKTDVRMELLDPSPTTTGCPYKGTAEYYAATVDGHRHDDVAWWYRHPTAEAMAIAGMVAFYDERVDVTVDGVRQQRRSGR